MLRHRAIDVKNLATGKFAGRRQARLIGSSCAQQTPIVSLTPNGEFEKHAFLAPKSKGTDWR